MEDYSLKKFSLSDFDKMETKDENNYEFIDGIVYMSPRPNVKHQEVMSNLHYELRNLIKSKPCKVFTEIELEYKDNVLIPDISVICELENTDFQRYKKAPEIVIEIISPSSRYTDTFTKLIKYELLGVKEYWIVNPEKETVTIYNFEIKTNADFSKPDKLVSAVFNELEIDLSDIFL
ncbi:MAG: Uma2 family endonuclease [Tissierellia bacterium]|nr:Uma2 family endonuclease [Tissierellia bacterium]MDD4436653.1 Uma2 family endonuclease [Tissierellia bacterium]